ncbi:MAG: extracellular solute-binding protein [Nitriliruptorales bacterium]|nr:extracellular solute-binding protein [Nitriliruptorales bacterium]
MSVGSRPGMRRYPLLIALVAFVAACAPPAEAPDDPAAAPEENGAAETAEPDADAPAADDDEQALVEAAIEEGSVGYWHTLMTPETAEELATAFRERYGLGDDFTVEFTALSTADLATRAEQEIGAGAVSVDVLSTGAAPFFYGLLEDGEITEYNSPSHEAYEAAFEAGIGEPGYFAGDAISLGFPMWNPAHIDLEIEEWADLLEYDLTDQVMIGDAENSLTHLATYMGMRQVLDREFFEQLAEFNPGATVRADDIAQSMVTGEFPVTSTGTPSRGYQTERDGVDLEIAYPTDGVVLVPQNWAILEQAPHPNAAKLLIDFVFSEEGQRVYQDGEAAISGRAGFESPSDKWAPPLEELNVIEMDWASITPQDEEEALEEWREIFR